MIERLVQGAFFLILIYLILNLQNTAQVISSLAGGSSIIIKNLQGRG